MSRSKQIRFWTSRMNERKKKVGQIRKKHFWKKEELVKYLTLRNLKKKM